MRKHDLRQPSDQKREEHKMTHLPFRSWCRHCIMGRGREEDCRRTTEEEASPRDPSGLHVHGSRGRENIGVLGCGETRAVLSTVVPRKTTGEWICRRLMAWLREIGLESVDIIVESNNDTGLTRFDRVVEHDESDDKRIEDECREKTVGS